jgi:tetratricopeptide (TPR) repeat protein
MQLGLLEQSRGKLGEARTLIEKAGRIEPDNPTVRNSLGQILLAQEHHDDAVVEFQAALASEPTFAPAWQNLGLVQAMRGQFADAVESFRKALASHSTDPQLLLNLGQALGETGAFDEAVEVLLHAVRLQPAVPQLRLALGDVLMHAGDAAKAIHQYREVERLVPGNPAGSHRIGLAMQQAGDIEASITALERTLTLAPGSASVQCDLANAFAMAGKLDRARDLFSDVAKHAGDAAVIGVAAQGLAAAGGTDKARALLAPLAEAGNREPNVAVALADVAIDGSEIDQAKERLEQALASALPAQKSAVLFALAEIEHRRGDFDRAFAHASEANLLKRARFDAAAETALVDRIVNTTSEMARSVRSSPASDEPTLIFVVGMQRSGLRLLDSILAAHPKVSSLGAAGVFQAVLNTLPNGAYGYLDDWDGLTNDDLAAIARQYLDKVRQRVGSAPVVVEAIPGNLVHLGLIHRLFPAANLVLCNRAPLDRCVACFFQDFAGASPYAYDLEALAHHSQSVDRLADHWRQQFGEAITDIDFDAVMTEPDSTLRSLFEKLDLEWQAPCSAVFDSRRASWRKRHTDYQRYLDPLMPRLA